MIKLMTLIAVFCLLATAGIAQDSSEVKVAPDTTAKLEKQADTEVKATKEKQEKVKDVKEPEIITTESGLRYEELVVGKGIDAKDKMHVDCHYALWLADSTGLVKGKHIQSSKDSGRSFQCQIGVRLIPGWSEGMVGMKEGGTRRIYVPWKLGYGEQGAGADIPGKTNLIFEIEFLKSLEK